MSSDLPEGWSNRRLLDICRPRQWPTISREKFTETGYPVYGANGQIGFYSEFNHADETIAITCRGATCGTINVVPAKSYITGNAMALDDLDVGVVAQSYLHQTLQHFGVTRSISGSAQPQITRQSLSSAVFPFPPLDEQRRIAEVLQSVDEVISNADFVLAQAKKVRQSTVNELLFPKEDKSRSDRLGCRLSELMSIAHGFAFKSEHFTTNRNDPILLTPGNFSIEKTLYFGERTKHYSGPIPDGYVLENGSLVVVMTDLTQDMAILGNAVEISGDGVVLHNQRIGRVSLLKPDLITQGYARLLLNSEPVQSQIKSTASGSTVRHTAPSRILECEVELPPLDEQERIVAIAKSLDDIVSVEERRRADDEVIGPLSHLRDLKGMIASDLLSGRVRVPA